MLFNSFEYLIFFCLVTVLYYGLPSKWRWMLLLAASYFFYGSWSTQYLGLIVISTIVTFYSGALLNKVHQSNSEDETAKKLKKRLIVAGSLIINLGILFTFKYFNFAIDVVNSISSSELRHYEQLLPVVGISFYTFQALSYTMDVYNQKIEMHSHLGKYALFVSFFPQLVAGPIEKAAHLLPQFSEEKKIDLERFRSGCILIMWAVFKKVVVADRLGVFVTEVYDNAATAEGIILIIATFLFAFQLYIDFSAYSEIAIGSARILGYDLTINFKRPYLATSFNDFWKRWHISLNNWFLEYLYIPLGGSKSSAVRTIINIFIVFLISGLWHGASWNFVIWGALNSFFLIVFDKLFASPKNTFSITEKMLRGTVILTFWSCSLVFFRANNFDDALTIYANFGLEGIDNLYNYGLTDLAFKFALRALVLIYVIEILVEIKVKLADFNTWPFILRWGVYIALPLAIIYLGAYGLSAGDSTFIYFQF